MKKLTLTTADQLQTEDRFYRYDDASKQVYIMLGFGRLNHAKRFAVKLEDEDKIYAVNEGLHWPDKISKNEQVVFLNHKPK